MTVYWESVKRPIIAVVLALLSALAPAIGLVCEADCEQPSASVPCHESESSPDRASWSPVPHACDLDHVAGQLFLLTASNDRSPASPPSAAVAALDGSIAFAVRPATGVSSHHPPGRPDRQLTSRTTILRI